MTDTDRWHVTVAEAAARTPLAGETAASALAHGAMKLLYYAPRGKDPQRPHEGDELYAVISGRGALVRADERRRFVPGDVLFVPAGVPHHFEEFDDTFAVWVVFYRPSGGESPGATA